MEIVLKLDPDRTDIDTVLKELVAYNDAAAGRASGHQPIALLASDNGNPVGGLTGRVIFDWLFVDLLVVAPAQRGTGLGSQLMQRAEDFARERGLAGVWLDTFSFQARPFYEKLGYTVFGTLDDHPVGGARYFLKKRLDGAS